MNDIFAKESFTMRVLTPKELLHELNQLAERTAESNVQAEEIRAAMLAPATRIKTLVELAASGDMAPDVEWEEAENELDAAHRRARRNILIRDELIRRALAMDSAVQTIKVAMAVHVAGGA